MIDRSLRAKVARRLGLPLAASNAAIFAAIDAIDPKLSPAATSQTEADRVARLAWPESTSPPRDDGLSPQDRGLYDRAFGADQ